MERYLLWGVVALGAAGWLAALLPATDTDTASTETAESRRGFHRLLLGGIGVSFLLLLLSLPNHAPFSPGGGLGRGLFAGGLAGVLGGWGLFRVGAAASGARRAAVLFSVALVVVPLPLLFFRAMLVDMLCGISLGWLIVTFLLVLFPVRRRVALPLAVGAGWVVALCAVALLGTYHDPLTPILPRGTWAAAGLLFAGFVPFSLIATLFLQPMKGVPHAAPRYVVSLVIVALVGVLLALKIVNDKRLLVDGISGLVLGALTWWLIRLFAPDPSRRTNADFASAALFLPLLLIASGYMVAFQLLQGFGMAILLIGFFLTVAFAMPDAREPEAASVRTTQTLLSFALFGLILVLYRLFTSRWGSELRGVNLVDHYALFGLIVGIALPRLLSGYLRIRPATSPVRIIVGVALAAILALIVPGVLIVIWGGKCILALLIGLALSTLLGGGSLEENKADNDTDTAEPFAFLPALLAVGIALALVQLTGHLMPLTEVTRTVKREIVVITLCIIGGLLLPLMMGGRQASSIAAKGADR